MRRPAGVRYLSLLRESITVPVLALHGEADPCLPPATRERDAEYVDGGLTVRTIPGVGHFLTEEAPTATTTALLEFLARL